MIKPKDYSFLKLILLDALSVVMSFFLAYFLRNFGPFRLFLDQVQPLETYLKVLPISIILLLISFSSFSLYSKGSRSKPLNELSLSIKAQVFWVLLLMSLSYLSKYDYSRVIVLLTFSINIILLNIFRLIYKKIEQKYFERGVGLTKVLIIGAGRPGRSLSRKLNKLERVGYKVIGFVDNHARSRENYPVIGKLSQLKKIIAKHHVDEVYFSDPRMSYEEILSTATQLMGSKISFKITNELFGLVVDDKDFSNLENIPTLDLWRSDVGKFHQLSKRLIDITLSSFGLILSLPFWLFIGLFIYSEDGRPILLKLKRVGYKGKTFNILKFRTMKKNTKKESGAPRSSKDNRVTKVGKSLRKSSLDELPQLINILKGEMSLVGPRPEIPSIVKGYSDWQRLRLSVKPGLTGLWQILGRKDLPLHENLEYDFYYINNQSILLDLTIIIKTIPVVLLRRGAY